MEIDRFLNFLHAVEKLKCNTRHSWTSTGRRESVAEHSWRLTLMALLLKREYGDLDMEKVIRMCILHDIGEAVNGDIPSFYKTDADREREGDAVASLLALLPDEEREEYTALFAEMEAKETSEAKLYKALDNMEAVISHNEAPIETWIPLEYSENLVYGAKNAEWSPYTRALRERLYLDSMEKIKQEGKQE